METNLHDKAKKVLIAVMAILSVLCYIAADKETVNAATLKTIPSTELSVSSSNKLILGYHNYTAKWNGVSGKIIKGKYNYHLLCVPIKTKTGSFSYRDFLELTFTNVGNINGRQLDARVHFNSVTVGKRNASGERSDNYFAVCYLADESLWMSSTISGIGAGYRAAKTIDATTTIYWHDTGETVELPFFQCLSDIDAGAGYFRESWEAKEGFSGIFYRYEDCVLSFSANKASATSASDYGGSDSLFKAGFYAPTSGGRFRSVFTEGNCATQFISYSAYAIMENPVKSSDGREINEEGDVIKHKISQRIGKFYSDTMTTYSSLFISDTLPEGISYKEAKVYDGNGMDITAHGTVSYDSRTRKVEFSMGKIWLDNIDNYTGQTLTMEITSIVDKPEEPMKTIRDQARTIIDRHVLLESNEVKDTIAIPYRAIYRYVSGTEDMELPESISIEEGQYSIGDKEKYYYGDRVERKTYPEEGAKHNVYGSDGRAEGSWVLSWDCGERLVADSDVVFTGVWNYVPAPGIVLIKTLTAQDASSVKAHGNPVFLFRITSETTGKSWYREAAFKEAAVKEALSKGEYRQKDGTMFSYRDGFIHAELDKVKLPYDRYIVEEIDMMRFKSSAAFVAYVGEGEEKAAEAVGGVRVVLGTDTSVKVTNGVNPGVARVRFENIRESWSGLSHVDLRVNRLKGGELP